MLLHTIRYLPTPVLVVTTVLEGLPEKEGSVVSAGLNFMNYFGHILVAEICQIKILEILILRPLTR
jgi:hypothetical protein